MQTKVYGLFCIYGIILGQIKVFLLTKVFFGGYKNVRDERDHIKEIFGKVWRR